MKMIPETKKHIKIQQKTKMRWLHEKGVQGNHKIQQFPLKIELRILDFLVSSNSSIISDQKSLTVIGV